MGGGGKKGGGGDQTVTTRTEIDPATQNFLDQYRQAATQGFEQFRDQGAAPGVGAGFGEVQQGFRGLGELNPALQQAREGFGGLTGGLNFAQQTGLGGIGEYFDPYQQEVIGGFQGDVQRQRELSAGRAADVATQAGAFGGNRGAVLEAQGLRDINQMEQQQLGQLRSQGFGSAADRMMQERQRMGGLGMAGLQGLQGIGRFQGGQQLRGLQGLQGLNEYQRNVAMQQRGQGFQDYQQALGLLGGGLGGGGQTTTQSQPTQGGGAFQGALGGAMTGFGMGGPIGGAIGGGLGLLGGLF